MAPGAIRGHGLAILLAVLLAAAIAGSAAGEWGLAAISALAAAAAVGAWARPELVLAAWFGLGPWGAYVLRWPWERSVFTFDRVMILAVVAGLLARGWRRGRLPAPGWFEVLWLSFALLGLANAALLSAHKPYAIRVVFDGFVLPVVLFYAVRAGFDAERGGRAVFWAAVLLALSLPWVGLVEFATRVDLMPWKAASIFRGGVVRANGPFSQDNSYTMISALLAVFLLWLPRVLGARLDGAARLAWLAAQATALLGALVPLFRAIIGALVAGYAVPAAMAGRARPLARAALVGLIAVVACAPLLAIVSGTSVFRERFTDPRSAYSRLATYKAALDVIEDHPFAGVGLASYPDYFDAKFGTGWHADVEEVSGEGAENTPHNNLLGAWAEMGIVAVFLYVAASLVLAGEAWRRRSAPALALMAVYWVPAMTLQTMMYPDITMYYLAMLAVVLGRQQ